MQLHPRQKVGQPAQQGEPLQEGPGRNGAVIVGDKRYQSPRGCLGTTGRKQEAGQWGLTVGGTETCFRLSHRRGAAILLYFQSLQGPLLSRPFYQSHGRPRSTCTPLTHSPAKFPHLALTILGGRPSLSSDTRVPPPAPSLALHPFCLQPSPPLRTPPCSPVFQDLTVPCFFLRWPQPFFYPQVLGDPPAVPCSLSL